MTATVHERMPFDRYALDLPGESSTSLRRFIQSPRAYAWAKEHDRLDRDELRVGRAGHTAILEPHLFASNYVVWPPDARVTATGRQPPRQGKEWDAFRFEHEAQGKTILTRAQHEAAIQISKAAREHKLASTILAEVGRAELSITWEHARTGIPMKARLDWLCSSLVDVKTASQIEPRIFSGASARYGYHTQASLYRAALAAVGIVDVPAKLIVIQSVEPFDVAVYSIPDELIVIGEQAYESALDRLAECRKSGVWPGIAADEEIELRLPTWALDDEDLEWEVSVKEVA